MTLEDRVYALRENLADACASAGRKPEEITVVAATKTVPRQTVLVLPKLGITDVGENRVGEFAEKYAEGLNWHIIGALQTNKVKHVIGKVCMIQSVDRISLAEKIDKLSGERGVITDILIEVNIGGEPSKSGIAPEALDELGGRCAELKNVRLRGLMSIPPIGAKTSLYEKMFALYESMPGADVLSMGMSDDYEIAVKCGANMIRPGRALFGSRETR